MLYQRVFNPATPELPKQATVIRQVKQITIFDLHPSIAEEYNYLPVKLPVPVVYFKYLNALHNDNMHRGDSDDTANLETELTPTEFDNVLLLKKHLIKMLVRNHYRSELNNSFDELDIERSSWERQKTEADEYHKDNTTANAQFITALALARGDDIDLLVTKIRSKATEYAVYTGTLIGTQHALEKEIDNAPDHAAILSLPNLPVTCKF